MTTIPEGADGLVIAGVAGQGGQEYAADTDDIIKILAESKITLVYDREGDRDRLVLKSADWWGPILIFGQQALAGGLGNILANAVWELIGKRRHTRIHLDVGSARTTDGEVVWFKGDGPAPDVLEALRVWRGE